MKDNSDIPLPLDQLRSQVLVFAIMDEATHQYEEITKGYVQLSTDDDGKNQTFHYLEVKDQQTNQVLMRSNLKIENNFGKQKGSIISWTDSEQPQYQEIALSFLKDQECDLFWRTICEKIGKSYLQINGMQKLEIPTVNNLNYILQKAKNSIDLMDYNIAHSKAIMQGLREVFYEMRKTEDQFGMGTICRIINAILSPNYSLNTIQTLMTGDNFYLILDSHEFRRGIRFKQIYEQKVGRYLKNKFNMPRQIFQKIQLSHRAVFYRENVLNLSEDVALESIMFMISKEAQLQIMSYLNRSRFLQTLINYSEYPRQQLAKSGPQQIQVNSHVKQQNCKPQLTSQQEKKISLLQLQTRSNTVSSSTVQLINDKTVQLINDKLEFIHEAITIHNQITGEQIKQTFKQSIYSSTILPFIKSHIDLLNPKALQILFSISQMDKVRFFQFLIDNFKLNSNENLLKSLMKIYLNDKNLRDGVIAIIEVLVPLFNVKKQLLDFFIGTFVCSVFGVGKDAKGILLLSNVLLGQLQNSSLVFPQLIKLKICQKLVSQYRNGMSLQRKSDQLELQIHKGSNKNKQIENKMIDSGLMECCMMIYLKHSLRYNIISSSMLQNLKIIQKMDSSILHTFFVQQYLNNQHYSTNQALLNQLKPINDKYIEHINKKTKIQHQYQTYLEVQKIVHEQILQNQHQQTYLMDENYAESSIQNIHGSQSTKDQLCDFTNNDPSHLKASVRDKKQELTPKKQDSLMFLKRIMDEIKKEDEQNVQRGPRKIVKQSEENKQTGMEFCFDLPQIDQIAPQQIQGT